MCAVQTGSGTVDGGLPSALHQGEVNTPDEKPRLAFLQQTRAARGQAAGIGQSHFAAHQLSILLLVLGFLALPLLPYLQPQALADGNTLSPFPRMEGLRRRTTQHGRGASQLLEKRNICLFFAFIPAS